MRYFASFGALMALSPLGSYAGHPTAPALPQGIWTVQVCLSQGYTTQQPCAYLDNRLILRVENPSAPAGQHGPVVFDQKISPELAQRIYMAALAAIHSFNVTPGPTVVDGTLYRVTLIASGNSAEVEFSGLDVSKMTAAVQELNGLLHETTHAF